MDSCMGWGGGKKYLRREVTGRIPDHTTYVEVFGGVGWVLFSKERSHVEIDNDICGELTNLFLQRKYHSKALQDELDRMLPSRTLFTRLKDFQGMTDLQRAARFFWLISFSDGAQGEHDASSKTTTSLSTCMTRIGTVTERLDMVQIEN